MAIFRRPVSARMRASRKVRGVRPKRRPTRSAYAPTTLITTGTNPSNHSVFRGIGFPDRLTANLVYSESIILDPSAGTPCPFSSYLLTSLFDPQNALGGGQPTYHDQFSAVYSRYIVNGAKITVSFSMTQSTTNNIGPYLCGITCGDGAGLPSTSPSALLSTPNTVARLVSTQDGTITMCQTYSRKNVYPEFSDGLQARTNANPSVNWYAKVFATPQGVDIEQPINCTVRIEFNATYSDVIQVIDI